MASDLEAISRKLSASLARRSEIRVTLLFGSAARGRLRSSSDVDVAVASDHPLTLEARIDLANSLAIELGREVDIIDLKAVSGTILREALTKGHIIKKADPELLAELMRKLWYSQADMMPYVQRILTERRRRFLDG